MWFYNLLKFRSQIFMFSYCFQIYNCDKSFIILHDEYTLSLHFNIYYICCMQAPKITILIILFSMFSYNIKYDKFLFASTLLLLILKYVIVNQHMFFLTSITVTHIFLLYIFFIFYLILIHSI